MSIEIDALELKVETSAEQASSGIDKLTAALSRLKSITKGGAGLTAVRNQLEKLNTSLNAFSNINIQSDKITALKESLSGLSDIPKAPGLASTMNALNKLPQISDSLEVADLGKFATQMNQVASAVRPLATEMQKVSNGFAAFPIRIQKIIQGNAGLVASNKNAAKSFGVLGTGISSVQAKFGIYFMATRRVASEMAGWLGESNKYVEDLNLFNVAMGDAAQSAYDYAQAVHDALGIDPAEWMRNQGMFKQIASGFGVVASKANLMSKNLTQLAYDMSSFFNAPVDEAMQKVQSGIAGELEPLRRWGYALDQATLQEIAYKHGIDMKIASMTQAQKSQIRYLAIMEQSGNVMGDMARTIQTPANAMRILHQQITQLTRALGNLLIPFLQKVIPYVQAFVEVLTEAIQRVATLIGFKLPTIDYSGMENGAGDAGDAVEDVTSSVKELKNALLGIDELNILAPTGTSKKDDQAGASNDAFSNIELPEYDFLQNIQKDTEALKEQMRGVLDLALKIGAAFLVWKVSSAIWSALPYIQTGIKTIGELFGLATGKQMAMTESTAALLNKLKLFGGIALVISGTAMATSGLADIFKSGEVTWASAAKYLGGISAMAAGLALALNAPIAGVGLLIGGFAGLGAGLYSIVTGGASLPAVALSLGSIAAAAGGATLLISPFAGAIVGAVGGVGLFGASLYQLIVGPTSLPAVVGALGGTAAAAIGLGVAFGPVPAIIAGVVGVVATLTTVIVKNWDAIKTKTSELWSTVKTKTSEAWNNIKSTVSSGTSTVVGWLQELPGKAGYALGYVLGTIVSWGSDLVSTIKEKVPAAVNAAVQFFSELPEKISGALSIAVQAVQTFTSSVGSWFSQTVPQIINNVGNWFLQLPQRIYEAIASFWNMFVSIGELIIDGIFQGLNSFFGAIGDFVGGVVDGFKSALGIHSPSRIFRDQIGLNVGLGVAQGITNSTGSVLSSISTLNGQMQSAFEIKPVQIGSAIPKSTFASPDVSAQVSSTISATAALSNGTDAEQSNRDVVNAVMAIGQMITKAVNDKDNNIVLDGKKVSRALHPYNKQTEREKGGSLIKVGG